MGLLQVPAPKAPLSTTAPSERPGPDQRPGSWQWKLTRRSPLVADTGLVVLLSGAGLLEQLGGPAAQGAPATPVRALVVIAAVLPLLLRRRRPFVAQIAIAAVVSGSLIWPINPGSVGSLVLLFATFQAMAAAGRRSVWLPLVVSIAAITARTQPWLAPPTRWAYGYVVLACVLVAGRAQHRRAELGALLAARLVDTERHRGRLHTLAVQDARLDLAREVRTAVISSLEAMSSHAGAAARALRKPAGEAEAALAKVEAAGRDALTELGRVLLVLRRGEGEDWPAAVIPTPTLPTDSSAGWARAHAWFGWRPAGWAVDMALLLVLAGVAMLEFGPEHQVITGLATRGDPFSWKAQAWALGWITLILARRRAPFSTAVAMSAMALLQNSFGYFTPISDIFALQLAVFSVGMRAARPELVWAAAGIGAIGITFPQPLTISYAGSLFIFAMSLAGAAYLGRVVAERDRLNEALDRSLLSLERERETELLLALHRDRLALARETHDLVAHAITLMVVQAGAARIAAPRDRSAALEAALRVVSAGHQAHGELARLLTTLQSSHGTEPDAPTWDVEDLIQQARDAGLDVSLDVEGTPRAAVHATVHRSAQRIVQESLTNARKHAPGSPVRVTLCYRSDEIELRVENIAGFPREDSSWASSGHGLLGIRERVAMLGGQVRAGREDDLFVVHARLPLVAG